MKKNGGAVITSVEFARLRRRYVAFNILTPLISLFVAAFFAGSPNLWFASDLFGIIGDWARSVWPKLSHDALRLDARVPLRGAKYASFVICCLSLGIVTSFSMVSINWRLAIHGPHRITLSMVRSLWTFPVALGLLGYLLFIETSLVGSNARIARGISNSGLLWFWIAFLWWALSMVLGLTALIAAKLFSHGWPDEERESDLKVNRWEDRS